MIFDTHAHYDNDSFDMDREQILESLPLNGIAAVTDVGASIESSAKAVLIANQYPYIYAAVGVHPSSVNELNEEKLLWLEETARKEKKVVAIGEIGLDYHWNTCSHDLQKEWYIRQLELARKLKLPVIIHSRDASQDNFNILKAANAGSIGGVIHCYSESYEMAKEYVKMGFYLGIGGVLTFKNARVIKEVVAGIGLEHLLLETDCPYLAPVPYRSKRNSSLYLPEVVCAISLIKNIPEKEVMRVTFENAKKLYRLEELNG